MEILHHFRPEYSLDNYFRLHYGEEGEKRLFPCEEVSDKDLTLGIVANSHVNPTRLLLGEKDRVEIQVILQENGQEVVLPWAGKSAFILLKKQNDPKTYVTNVVRSLLNGNPDRRDHIHIATVGDIQAVGWHVFWAPLQMLGNLLHVRMVADRTLVQQQDPTPEDATQLATVFRFYA